MQIASAALILACGIYVAFEFALVKVPLHRLERDVEAGMPGAGVVLQMKREMNALLAASQFGITLTSLGLTLALEPAIHAALPEMWQDATAEMVGMADAVAGDAAAGDPWEQSR